MNKVMKVCIALAAIAAFAVLPATASALNSATIKQGGVALSVSHESPKQIIGTANHNSNTKLTNHSGEVLISCTTNTLTGNLETNTHSAIEGTITAASFTGTTNQASGTHTHCSGSTGHTLVTPSSSANGLPYCMQINSELATDRFRVRGGTCTQAAREITFSFDATTIFGTVTCHMTRAAAIEGTYTTGANPKGIITNVEFVQHGGICPVTSGTLSMEFSLFRENGSTEEAITIDQAGT